MSREQTIYDAALAVGLQRKLQRYETALKQIAQLKVDPAQPPGPCRAGIILGLHRCATIAEDALAGP